MSYDNQETKLSNETSELKQEGEQPLLSGEGGKDNPAEQDDNEVKNEDLAAEDEEDNDDYDGVRKRDICIIEKNKGSEKFKENDYIKASKHFTKALMAYKYASQEIAEQGTEELEKIVKEIQIPCHLNLALCFLKMGEYQMAKVHANHVLEIDSDNVKALYRRAMVNYHTGYLTDAKDDLKQAYELDPNNQEVVKLMHMVREKKKAENEKERRMNQKIISNLEFEEKPATTSATTALSQTQQKEEEDADKEEKHLKSKNVGDKDKFPELNRVERKMFQTLKYGLLLPVNWVKNKCCSKRNTTKEKKNN